LKGAAKIEKIRWKKAQYRLKSIGSEVKIFSSGQGPGGGAGSGYWMMACRRQEQALKGPAMRAMLGPEGLEGRWLVGLLAAAGREQGVRGRAGW
jgi:hypothetical protein